MAFNDELKTATVVVPERQLSLAIGREGQNVRLAAKLTGWKIDIKGVAEPDVNDQPDIEIVQLEVEITAPVQSEQLAESSDAPVLAVEEVSQEAVEMTPDVETIPADLMAELVGALGPNGQEDGSLRDSITSPEEELLAQEVLEPETVSQESSGVSVDDDAIWAIPAINKGPSVLRFKEDIMPTRVHDNDSSGQGADRPRSKGKRSRR